jgi:hypothetical protein
MVNQVNQLIIIFPHNDHLAGMIGSPSSPKCHWCDPIPQVNGETAKGIEIAEKLAQSSGQAATRRLQHCSNWDLVYWLHMATVDDPM